MPVVSIDAFIEATNLARSSDDVSRLFADALKHFGYDQFCYSLITDHPSVGLSAGHGVVCNYPNDWMEHYAALGYEKKDPVPRYCFTTDRPFIWDVLESRGLEPEEKKVMEEAREARLLDGIAIPICGHNGEVAGIGMARSIGGDPPDAILLNKLRALSCQFHLAYTELERANCLAERDRIAEVRLTPREREILHWTAEGKSDSVIAEILGISHSAVRFHMNNIFKKLNANERTLATVKAIRHGLILPSYVT
jgi:DNA-binding CsgD family transcriptional regulator